MAVPRKQINHRDKLVEVKRFLMSIPAGAELQRQIAEAAYYRAEKRGFAAGFEHQDWIEAEREILGSIQTPASHSFSGYHQRRW